MGLPICNDVDGESNLSGEDSKQASTSRGICNVRKERVCKYFCFMAV